MHSPQKRINNETKTERIKKRKQGDKTGWLSKELQQQKRTKQKKKQKKERKEKEEPSNSGDQSLIGSSELSYVRCNPTIETEENGERRKKKETNYLLIVKTKASLAVQGYRK